MSIVARPVRRPHVPAVRPDEMTDHHLTVGTISMAQFMLLLHETPGTFAHFSPEEIQAIIEKYSAWSAKLAAAGKLRGGAKLRDEGGKHVTKAKGKDTLSVVDGPYVETKEVIGGYFTIEAADYAEAAELVADCPHLTWGRIEIREADPMGD